MSDRKSRFSSKSLRPALPGGFVTYAVFSLPNASGTGWRVSLQVVASRDLQNIDIPKNAYEFYFCDAPSFGRAINNDPLRDEINQSPMHYIAQEIITAEELRSRLLQKGIIMPEDPPPRRDKNGDMLSGDIRHSVWTFKAKSTAFHAVSRAGHYLQTHGGRGITVIDADKNIMMAPDDKAPRMTRAGVVPPPPQRPKPMRQADRRFRLD